MALEIPEQLKGKLKTRRAKVLLEGYRLKHRMECAGFRDELIPQGNVGPDWHDVGVLLWEIKRLTLEEDSRDDEAGYYEGLAFLFYILVMAWLLTELGRYLGIL